MALKDLTVRCAQEAIRGALQATHASAVLARQPAPTAAKLLRTAEGLIRAALATAMQPPPTPLPPTQAAAPAVPRRRPRARKAAKKQTEEEQRPPANDTEETLKEAAKLLRTAEGLIRAALATAMQPPPTPLPPTQAAAPAVPRRRPRARKAAKKQTEEEQPPANDTEETLKEAAQPSPLAQAATASGQVDGAAEATGTCAGVDKFAPGDWSKASGAQPLAARTLSRSKGHGVQHAPRHGAEGMDVCVETLAPSTSSAGEAALWRPGTRVRFQFGQQVETGVISKLHSDGTYSIQVGKGKKATMCYEVAPKEVLGRPSGG
jgi:hypothetical protein